MSTRREFLLGATTGLLALHQSHAVNSMDKKRKNPLRVLILGGTGFIGPHFVRAALDRGHTVSVFNRGKSDHQLPLSVERLIGDRNGDLAAIANRDWDAVFDMAAYVPKWVRSLGKALDGRVNHYTFISTIMAYRSLIGANEQSALETYSGTEDPYSLETPGNHYGAMKVLCEREAEAQFPGRTLVVRPATIVGPGEMAGAFSYLVARIERGGEILAAGEPSAPVQLIDVRDLAEWTVRLAERGQTGSFTASGPVERLSWSELLGGVRAAFSVATHLTWVPSSWITERGVGPFSSLLFWPSQVGLPGSMELNVTKAVTHGLSFRPLNATVVDTSTWYRSLPEARRKDVLVAYDTKNKSLEDSIARERELLALWHAEQKSQ